jgi:hypothetical protein
MATVKFPALQTETLIVLGVALALVYMVNQAKNAAVDTVKKVVPYIDPTSDQNLAYQGSSALARWLSGSNDGTLGTIVFDYAHKAEPDGAGGYINYTPAQQAADLAATRQLEAGFHGM